MPIDCTVCGGRFSVSVASLRSLEPTYPGCNASFAAAGEKMLAVEAENHRYWELMLVAIELEDHDGLAITDAELDAAQSMDDLVRTVRSRLDPSPDCEARAARLVAEAARRTSRWSTGQAN